MRFIPSGKTVTSDDVANSSGIVGSTVTAALNTIGGVLTTLLAAVAALQALVFQAPHDNGALGASPAINFSTNSYQRGTLTAICTPTFTLPTSTYEVYLELTQGGIGSFTVTWPASVHWSDGTPPVLSTAVGAKDLIKFIFDGTVLRGYVVLMNIT